MALTKTFKETVKERVDREPEFRAELFREAVQLFLEGDVDTGKAVLRDYINATIGFEELGEFAEKSPKSLMRMFGSEGNPQARNLFDILVILQRQTGVELFVDTK